MGDLHYGIASAINKLRPIILKKHADADFIMGCLWYINPTNGYSLERMVQAQQEIESQCKTWPNSHWLVVVSQLVNAGVAFKLHNYRSATIYLSDVETDLKKVA